MPAGPPILFDGTIHVATRGGVLMLFDAETLEPLWRRVLEAPLVSAPRVTRDWVVQSGARGRAYAFDRYSGEPIAVFASPEIMTVSPGLDNDRIALAGREGTVTVYRRGL
jgi:outer membrane protein assembly factor BamB